MVTKENVAKKAEIDIFLNIAGRCLQFIHDFFLHFHSTHKDTQENHRVQNIGSCFGRFMRLQSVKFAILVGLPWKQAGL